MLELPPLLNEMLDSGRWPRTPEQVHSQFSSSWAKTENIKRLAPDQWGIFLNPPPFLTVREKNRPNDPMDFWNWPIADPTGIDFDLSIDIGDFGPGSDSPILLDYRVDRKNPRVIRLQWPLNGQGNRWVHMADDFETFVVVLGL